MKPLVLLAALIMAFVSPEAAFSAQNNNSDLSSDQYTGEAYMSERDRMIAYLSKAKEIKQEALADVKSEYAGYEEDMVGVDEVMDSFEVNELVAEIMEAEGIY